MAKKIIVEEKPTIWKDRKRILGLPISFTRYRLTEDRLYLKKGLLSTTTDEMLLFRVLDLRLVRKFSQKIFGVGTITLISTDKTCPKFDITNVKQSDRIRKLLSSMVEKQREEKRIVGREFLGGTFSDGSGELDI